MKSHMLCVCVVKEAFYTYALIGPDETMFMSNYALTKF